MVFSSLKKRNRNRRTKRPKRPNRNILMIVKLPMSTVVAARVTIESPVAMKTNKASNLFQPASRPKKYPQTPFDIILPIISIRKKAVNMYSTTCHPAHSMSELRPRTKEFKRIKHATTASIRLSSETLYVAASATDFILLPSQLIRLVVFRSAVLFRLMFDE